MSFIGHTERVTTVAFNNKGDQIVVGYCDSTIIVFDVFTYKKIHQFTCNKYIYKLLFNYTDDIIISQCDINIWLCNIVTGSIQTIALTCYVHTIAISPINNILLLGCMNGTILSLNAKRPKGIKIFDENGPYIYGPRMITHIIFSKDGSKIAFCNGVILIVDMLTKLILKTLHHDVRTIAFNQDETQIIANAFLSVKKIDIFSKETEYYNINASSVFFALNDKLIVTKMYSQINIHDAITKKHIRTIEDHGKRVNDLAISKCGKYIVSCSQNSVLMHCVNVGHYTKPALHIKDELSEMSQNEPSEMSQNEPSEMSQNEPSEMSQNEPYEMSYNSFEMSQNEPSEMSQNEPSEMSQNEPYKMSYNSFEMSHN